MKNCSFKSDVNISSYLFNKITTLKNLSLSIEPYDNSSNYTIKMINPINIQGFNFVTISNFTIQPIII
jgi:hypothetical protein